MWQRTVLYVALAATDAALGAQDKAPPPSFDSATFGDLPEGRYTVRLTKGDEIVTGTIDLVPDPLTPHSAEDRATRQSLVLRLYAMQADLAYLGDASASLRDELRARAKSVTGDATLAADLEAQAAEFDKLNRSLVDQTSGLVEGDPKLREKVIGLYGSVLSYGGRPTVSQVEHGASLDGELKKALADFGSLTGDRLNALNGRLQKAGLKPVEVPRQP